MLHNRQVQMVRLSEMTPNLLAQRPPTRDKFRNFTVPIVPRPPTRDRLRNSSITTANSRPETRDKSRNFSISTAASRPETRDKSRNFSTATSSQPGIEEKSVDLISVTSEDYEDKDDDQVSFDEGRLQQWNMAEYQMQLVGALAGIMLLFGCGTISTWAITDFIKDVQINAAEWVEVDYSFDLFDMEHEDFLTSRHVIIAMVVLSYNIGCIIGAILGAFITPLLPNRVIYTVSSVLMLFTGITLTMHTSAFYCAKSRLVAGLVFGLVQLTLLVQAAESTTKKVRRWMLVVVAYVNAVSSVLSTLIFYFYDDREQITYTEDNTALYIISYLMGGCAVVALILNFIFTKDTIPFHLVRGEETKAFKEMSRLKADYLSMLDIRYEFERIRFDVTQSQLEANRSLANRSNHKPLISMCCVRILNLLFTSVPITLVLVWDPRTSVKSDDFEDDTELTHTPLASGQPPTDSDAAVHTYISPLLTLSIIQGFRILCSIAVIIRHDKYHFNRFAYKMSGFVGATLIVWFVARFILGSIEIIQTVLFFPVSLVTMMGFNGLPIPLDIIQLNQSADSYARIKNTWSVACAIFVENFVHIFLIIQLDMIFGVMFVFLVNGITMIYFSLWLLKNMPNVVSIHPITVAIIARYPFKNSLHDNTIHI